MPSRALMAIVAVAAVIGVLWVTSRRERPVPHPPPPATHTAAAALARPTAPATPSPEPPREHLSSFVVPWEPEPTPSPTPPEEEPTPRPGPSPTPEVPECVTLTYEAGIHPGTVGGILVDVRLQNRCGRDLGPLEVWFWVGGFREGALVQSVRGHPFDAIPRNGEGKAAIVLPGSIDWYDRIEVQLIAPSGP